MSRQTGPTRRVINDLPLSVLIGCFKILPVPFITHGTVSLSPSYSTTGSQCLGTSPGRDPSTWEGVPSGPVKNFEFRDLTSSIFFVSGHTTRRTRCGKERASDTEGDILSPFYG